MISVIEFGITERNSFHFESIIKIDLKHYSAGEYDTSLGNDHYDMVADTLIEDNIEVLKSSEAIVISYIGNEADNFLGLILIHHIRLHRDLRQISVVCIGTEILQNLVISVPNLSQILLTKGIGYFLSENYILPGISGLQKELKFHNRTDATYKESFLEKIVIPIPEEQQGRHGVANQWGAYRMAQVAGIEEKIKYKYPKTLYFKYLLAQAKAPKPITPNFPTVKKILFIDDNYQKGWKDCLEGLFGEGTIEAYESWQKAQKAGANTRIESDEYDLVFLDFYLGEGDIIGKGKEALDTIKGLNSVLPVIMFTASNKAWNMHELHQVGADGYFVKEHPETAKDPDFSVKNFENFQQTVTQCVKKGELLRKFWKQKKLIKKSNLLVNKPNQINRERILERLIMFIGLLKKAKEQTKFDTTTFFYSDWELAFLTLWSTLNEIQEVYYEKTPIVYKDKSGKSYTVHENHYDKPNMPKANTWKLNLPPKFTPTHSLFIEYDFTFKYDSSHKIEEKNGIYQYSMKNKSILLYNGNHKKSQYYSFNIKGVNPVNVELEKTLHSQIAFILLNLKATNTLLKNLKELNDSRNHLYLTHGEDMSNPQFDKLYQEQRESIDWEKHIKQLFEIVYFLCTGQTCVL